MMEARADQSSPRNIASIDAQNPAEGGSFIIHGSGFVSCSLP